MKVIAYMKSPKQLELIPETGLDFTPENASGQYRNLSERVYVTTRRTNPLIFDIDEV